MKVWGADVVFQKDIWRRCCERLQLFPCLWWILAPPQTNHIVYIIYFGSSLMMIFSPLQSDLMYGCVSTGRQKHSLDWLWIWTANTLQSGLSDPAAHYMFHCRRETASTARSPSEICLYKCSSLVESSQSSYAIGQDLKVIVHLQSVCSLTESFENQYKWCQIKNIHSFI